MSEQEPEPQKTLVYLKENKMIQLINDDGEIMQYKLKTRYNHNSNEESEKSGLKCEDETLAQQQFAEECDINTIVRRFGLTGELPQDVTVPQSGDFTNVTDFHTAMNVVRAAQEAFAEMPSATRERFANDPGKFLDFVGDEKNREEASKMGILDPGKIAASQGTTKTPAAPTEAPGPDKTPS